MSQRKIAVPDNSIIEQKAVSYLKLKITTCARLNPLISENDKTPSWDGNVLVYKSENFDKSNLESVVPVQVKGKWIDTMPGDSEIKFSVEVPDLKNYQKSGGIFFFVVLCNHVTNKIYYNSLLPIDLDGILKGKEKQKTISISMYSFPSDFPDEMYSIFKNFAFHSKRQYQRDESIRTLYFDGKLKSLKTNVRIGYSIIPYNTKEDAINYMFKYPTYSYLRINDLNMDIVLGKIYVEKFIEKQEYEFEIEGKRINYHIYREYDKNKNLIMRIGENIYFDVSNKKLNFKFADTLSDRIKDFLFIKYLLLNNDKIKENDVIAQNKVGEEILYKDIVEHLDFLIDFKELMKKFMVEKELLLKDMTQEEWNKMNALVNSCIYGKPVNYSLDGKPGIGIFEISNLKLLIFCKKVEDIEGYKLSNVFDYPSMGIKYKNIDFMLSPYFEILNKKRLLDIDNIDLDKVYDSIILLRTSDDYDEHINLYVLDLIGAYDINQRKEFLCLAEKLINYILKCTKDRRTKDIYKINKIQIKKRIKKLSSVDKNYLFNLKTRAEELEFILCANILLESFEEAELVFKKLKKENQEKFAEYPIYGLWKNADLNQKEE